MRQIVRKVKNGKEVTFVCSKCGNFVHDVFIPTGKKCEDGWDNWDKIPEKCSCGERLTNRQPIIDENVSDIDNVHEGVREGMHKNMREGVSEGVYENVHKNVKGNSDIYGARIKDLENAMSIDYFDMRLNSFKRSNFKIPDNIDLLRMECIKRNISHTESNIEQLSSRDDRYDKDDVDDIDDKREMRERLNVLRKKYDDLLEKLEDKKDVDKKMV